MLEKADRQRIDWLDWFNRIGPLLALLLVYGLFALFNFRITSLAAIETIIQQTVIVGIAAIGMTMVIIVGGIDLSVGSIIAMSSVTGAWLIGSMGFSPIFAVFGGIVTGLLCGSLNGLLITRLKIVPFIATLGTLLIVRGFAKGLANNMPINVPQTWLSNILAALPPNQRWQLIPPGGWIMILLAIIIAILIKYTRLGRHIVAVGSNEDMARLCGVAVEKVRLFVYAAAGGFAGIAGLISAVGTHGAAQPSG